jgi:polyhydroxyalkanoate synthesis regulator phasin
MSRERRFLKHMAKRKILLIGGTIALLTLGIVLGAFFAGPLFASANNSSSNTQTAAASPTATPNKYCEQYYNDLAKRLGVSVSTLQQDQQAAKEDVLAQLVKDGKLTQQQADEIKKRIESHQACTGRGPGIGQHLAMQVLHKYLPDIANEVAQGLHISTSDLKADLQSGMSLHDIAVKQHVSDSDLQTIVTNAIQHALNKAVKAGDLTQQQADQIKQQLQAHPEILNRLLNAHFGNNKSNQ